MYKKSVQNWTSKGAHVMTFTSSEKHKKKQNRSTEGCSKFKVRKNDKLRWKWSQHKNKVIYNISAKYVLACITRMSKTVF